MTGDARAGAATGAASVPSGLGEKTPRLPAPVKVVFDFGKVVFDWEPRALVARLLPKHAPDDAAAAALEAAFFQGFGGDWGEFDRGTMEAGELAERISGRTDLPVAEARGVIDAVPGALRVLPPMAALLGRLAAAGIPVYYLSNMPRPYADALEAAHPFLRRPPVGVFRDGIFSGRVGRIKPEPEIYALALERFGLDARETLFVDDVQANVDAAKAAGWQAVRFETVAQCEGALRAVGLL